LIQTFFAFFTTGHLFHSNLFEDNPNIVPLLWTAISSLQDSLLKPKLLAAHSQAVLRTLLPLLDPILDALKVADDDESASVTAEELAESKSPFIRALRSKTLVDADYNVRAALLAYILALTVIPHTLVPWAMLQITKPNSNLETRWAGFQKEIDEHVLAKQEEGIGNILPPVSVHVGHSNLRVCRALIADTERLYSCGWDEYSMQENVTLPPENPLESGDYLLQKDSRVTAAYWLQEKTLPSPESYEKSVEDVFKSRKSMLPSA
jgi:hypothetical protein